MASAFVVPLLTCPRGVPIRRCSTILFVRRCENGSVFNARKYRGNVFRIHCLVEHTMIVFRSHRGWENRHRPSTRTGVSPLSARRARRANHQQPAPGARSRRRTPRMVRGERIRGNAGISGAKGREQRPGLDALMKALARREVDMVAAWSVDRLGRSLTGLLELLTELHAKKGLTSTCTSKGLDTSTPSGRAMFQMMGVFAEFERAMIRERVPGGPGTSTSGGDTSRPQVHRGHKGGQPQGQGCSGYAGKRYWFRKIAREVGLGVGTVMRLTASRDISRPLEGASGADHVE